LKLSVGEFNCSGDTGLGIVADGSGSVAGPGASISSYKFVFSDGANDNYSTGAQEQPSVEYPCTNGTYTVTLTVTNSASQTASIKRTIQVG
jgi:PKD repeat protein